jgi:hypothetical protein
MLLLECVSIAKSKSVQAISCGPMGCILCSVPALGGLHYGGGNQVFHETFVDAA